MTGDRQTLSPFTHHPEDAMDPALAAPTRQKVRNDRRPAVEQLAVARMSRRRARCEVALEPAVADTHSSGRACELDNAYVLHVPNSSAVIPPRPSRAFGASSIGGPWRRGGVPRV